MSPYPDEDSSVTRCIDRSKDNYPDGSRVRCRPESFFPDPGGGGQIPLPQWPPVFPELCTAKLEKSGFLPHHPLARGRPHVVPYPPAPQGGVRGDEDRGDQAPVRLG